MLSVLLYPVPFLLIRAPRYNSWSASPYGHDLEYGITTTGVDADVVIYGDSTAVFGLDPVRMSRELGVKVFNVPNQLPSLLVLKDLGLRRYLAHNKPPRLIVFYLPPWHLDTEHLPSLITYDGDEMMLRHGTFAEIAGYYRHHVQELLTFPFGFYRVNTISGFLNLRLPDPPPSDLARTQGHRDLPKLKPMGGQCTLPADYLSGHLPMGTARELVDRFNTKQTQAILYLAPVADCTNISEVERADYSQFPGTVPHVMAPSTFANDGYYAHPMPPNVPLFSDQLVERIRPLLAR